MCSSIADNKKRSRRIFPLLWGTLIIAIVIGCSLFSWAILQDPYAPLPQYPNAKNIQTQYTDEDFCCTETITTFETTDSPEEVYEFYKKEFRFRIKWRSTTNSSGLFYSSFWGCPVGSYSITASQNSDKTEVTIRLSTHICI
jgi:hypothetical protein